MYKKQEGFTLNDLDYTYAVARIRALETSLFSGTEIERLMACVNEEQCLQFLHEKGWGDGTSSMDIPAVLKREEEKIWEVMKDIASDMSIFDVFSFPKLYHNLKAAIKQACSETETENIFFDDCVISGEEMLQIVKNKEFGRLPGDMAETALEAYNELLHTRDGQLCDVIIDRASLEAIYKAGKSADEEMVKNYAESAVAIADIKIAVRSLKTKKTLEFMRHAMVPCQSINVEQLSKAAAGGMDAVREYLAGTDYAGGVNALAKSPSAFERWCDNRMMETIRPQKYNAFSAGPLIAYILARENEIKTVRIILSCKQNDFSEEAIRERIREMYV